jgi:hypothetical protein
VVAVGMLSKRAIFFRIMSIYGDMMGKHILYIYISIYDSMFFSRLMGYNITNQQILEDNHFTGTACHQQNGRLGNPCT